MRRLAALALGASALLLMIWFLVTRWGTPLANSLFLTLAVWLCAAVVTLQIYFLVSLDDFQVMAARAAIAAGPVTWLVPGLMLMSFGNRVLAFAGLAVIAVAACLVFSQRPPRRRGRLSHRTTPDPSLFPFIAATLAMQTSLCCLSTGYPRWSAALCILAMAIWTRCWVLRAGDASDRRSPWGALWLPFHVAAVVLVSMIASVEAPRYHYALNPMESANALLSPPPPEVPVVQAGTRTISIAAAKPDPTGIPGLLLLPPPEARPELHRLVLSGIPAGVIHSPLSFPFSGEYRIFSAATGWIPDSAQKQTGTPLDALYATGMGGSMETEAWQPLFPPLDLERSMQMLLTIRSGGLMPGTALLQLVAGGRLEEIGSASFGLAPHAQETLRYQVHGNAARKPVDALRIVFRNPVSVRSQSVRVAIVTFTLIPGS